VGEIGYFFNIILTFPIFNVLMLLNHVFSDLGLSIVVLTLIIRLCLFPLTLKQLRSTKATQAIQPLIADIRKKYAGDQQAQYRAMQALYKEYNINPLSGCLPLLLQLPILYGLFYALRLALPSGGHLTVNAVNQYIYPFLPKFSVLPSFDLRWFTFINHNWWISLANPDPTHILPVLAGLATFAQLRMSQARTTQQSGQKSDMMAQQMRIMSFVMPFITFFVALNFPAGLALYWTTSSIFSMVQQYFVTGWGSLFSFGTPGLATSGGSVPKSDSKAYFGDGRQEKALLNNEADSDSTALSERTTRVNGYSKRSSGSYARRHRRSNKAKTQRYGTTPRRDPSHS